MNFKLGLGLFFTCLLVYTGQTISSDYLWHNAKNYRTARLARNRNAALATARAVLEVAHREATESPVMDHRDDPGAEPRINPTLLFRHDQIDHERFAKIFGLPYSHASRITPATTSLRPTTSAPARPSSTPDMAHTMRHPAPSSSRSSSAPAGAAIPSASALESLSASGFESLIERDRADEVTPPSLWPLPKLAKVKKVKNKAAAPAKRPASGVSPYDFVMPVAAIRARDFGAIEQHVLTVHVDIPATSEVNLPPRPSSLRSAAKSFNFQAPQRPPAIKIPVPHASSESKERAEMSRAAQSPRPGLGYRPSMPAAAPAGSGSGRTYLSRGSAVARSHPLRAQDDSNIGRRHISTKPEEIDPRAAEAAALAVLRATQGARRPSFGASDAVNLPYTRG